MMKDLEKNNFDIENQDGLIKTEEINLSQGGKEVFNDGQESFLSNELNTNSSEISDLSSTDNKKSSTEKNNEDVNKITSGGASGMVTALPGILVTFVGAIATIGVATGLIGTQSSNHINNFLTRSTELGFEINGDNDKTFLLSLTNDSYEANQDITVVSPAIFNDLSPNTVYDLTAYDTSVSPMKKIFNSSYKTKANDTHSSNVSSSEVVDDYLIFTATYEGDDIDFVTIEVTGDNNESLYLYEGKPINEFSVYVGENTNVNCTISINGEVTSYEQLIVPESGVDVPVESVSLDQTTLSLIEGETATLVANILPSNASNQEVTWTSNNENVATISNGVVTAVSSGRAIITVITTDGSYTASCTVSVQPSNIPVTGVSLEPENAQLSVGDTTQLSASVLPNNATNANVSYQSSNEQVATVDSNGVVTAIATGEAVITVTTEDGSYQDYCVITVS